MEDILRAIAAYLDSTPSFAPHVKIIVALWLICSLLALRFNTLGWARRRAILKRARRIQKADSRAYVLARARHEAELLGVVVQLCFVTIGLIVVASPEIRPSYSESSSIADLFIAPLLVAAQIITAIGSGRQRRFDVRIAKLPPARTLAEIEFGRGEDEREAG